MIISGIHIQSFGKINDLTLDLTSGINILTGGNESGKSTICSFIKFVFYGLPSKSEEKQRLFSWETSRAAGYVIFEDDSLTYRVERDAVMTCGTDGKITFSEKCAIFDNETNMPCLRGKNPGEEFFGIPENVFESTAYISQIGESKVGGRSLCEAAENILFSGDESANTKKALKKLDDARKFLWHKNKGGGQIAEMKEKLGTLEDRLDASKSTGARLIYLDGRRRELLESAEKAEREAQTVKEELERYERYTIKQLYRKFNKTRGEEAELRSRMTNLCDAETTGGAHIYKNEYIDHLRSSQSELKIAAARYEDAKSGMETARKKLGDMNEKLAVFEKFGSGGKRDALMKEMEQSRKSAAKSRLYAITGITGAVISLSLLVASLVMGGSNAVRAIFGIIAGACLVFAAAGFVLYGKNSKNVSGICSMFGCADYAEFDELVKASQKDEAALMYIIEGKRGAENKFDEASAALSKTSTGIIRALEAARFDISENTAESLAKAIAKCEAKKSEMEKLEIMIKEKQAKLSEYTKELSGYPEELIAQSVSEQFPTETESFDFRKKKRDYEFLVRSAASSKELMHNIEKEYSALSATGENPVKIAPEAEALKGKIAAASEKFESYVLAIEAMESASGKLREGISPKLAKTAGKVMSKLSGGKYKTLGVDADFAMSYFDGVTRGADSLSAGTSDIAYLSLRIALMDMLCKKSIPPFIFDESFSRLDADRLSNTLELLYRLYGEYGQCLVFTCHEREREIMKNIGTFNDIRI